GDEELVAAMSHAIGISAATSCGNGSRRFLSTRQNRDRSLLAAGRTRGCHKSTSQSEASMSTKKVLFLVFGIVGVMVVVCGGGCGAFIWWGYKETTSAQRNSEAFLALLAQGRNAEAYASGSSTLRSQQDRAKFDAEVKKLGLDDYSSVSWSGF